MLTPGDLQASQGLGTGSSLTWKGASNQGQKEPDVKRRIKDRPNRSGSENVSQLKGVPKEGLYAGSGQGWAKAQWPGGKERILNQSFLEESFVLIDQWDQTIQLLICDAKNENWKGLCLAFS